MRKLPLILAVCAASVLNGPATASAPPMVSAAPAEVRLPHISIRTLGRGPAIVLIPGLGTPRAVWDGIVPGLARDHRVILVQVNGFAGDDAGENLKGGVLHGIVADLHEYLLARHIVRVAVIGHSMGGLAAMMFANVHPEQLDRVMVVDALPFFAVLADPAATAESMKPTAETMRTTIASTFGKPVVQATIDADVKGLALKPASIARMRRWAAAADPRVTAQGLYDDLTTDFRPQLAGLKTPITVIVPWSVERFGEERTLGFYKRQFATVPKVSFVAIGDAGHFVMLDQPEKFSEAVEAFVQ